MADQDTHSITSETIDWRIPRPILYTASSNNSGKQESNTYSSNYEYNIKTIYGLENGFKDKLNPVQINIPRQENWFSLGSSSSTSSRTASSGSLLLTPSNLISLKYDTDMEKPPDTQSIASSTHFTLVNGITLPKKQLSTCCTKSRQLPVLIITMTIILFCGILAAILLVEVRAMELRLP